MKELKDYIKDFFNYILKSKQFIFIFKIFYIDDMKIKENDCDHGVAVWGKIIKSSEFEIKKHEFNELIDHFIKIGNRKAEPFPGHFIIFNNCPFCGNKIDHNKFN